MLKYAFLRLTALCGVALLLQTPLNFASPDNSISIPNSFSADTTISSSEVNSNFNESQSKYNTHSHTDITQLGTITSGSWQATAIDELYGGTGFTTYTTGDLLYSSASNTLSKLGIGSANQHLIVSGGIPAWTTYTGSTGIVTLGTIATGTWQGTDIAAGYGGIGSMKIDSGTASVVAGGGGTAITFAFTFGSAPKVIISYAQNTTNDHQTVNTNTITTTGFNGYSSSDSTMSCNWIAFGAE